jgi:hypothetical protein
VCYVTYDENGVVTTDRDEGRQAASYSFLNPRNINNTGQLFNLLKCKFFFDLMWVVIIEIHPQ